MKVWTLLLVALLAGSAMGYGQARLEFDGLANNSLPGDAWNTGAKKTDSPDMHSSGHVIVLEGDHYDFGSMQRGATLSHVFVLKNVGAMPVGLKKGKTTCKCTFSALDKNTLMPGETCEVEVEWTPKSYSDEFLQTAEIKITESISQQSIQLKVGGRVIQVVRPVPHELTFHNISSNGDSSALLRIFNFTGQTFKILGTESVEQATADRFIYTIEPLSEQELAMEGEALSGIGIRVTIKPGLPLGPIKQTVRVLTSIKEGKEILVPITGTVVSDISVMGGSNFHKDLGLLNLGIIDRSEGGKATLHLLVKGPYRHDVQMKVASTNPADIVKAHIGEPKEINNGLVIMYPLEIEIPAGSPAANHFGSQQGEFAKISIETTHPTAKSVPLYLKFLISR